MKNKFWLYILLCILVCCFIILSAFFALKNIHAHNKLTSYADIYREDAIQYIKSDSNMIQKYGDEFEVKFENGFKYLPVDRDRNWLVEKFLQVFDPQVPENIDDFNASVEMIIFEFEVKDDKYAIIYNKTEQGNLAVSGLDVVED